MTTDTKKPQTAEANIKDGQCMDCGASVANLHPSQKHENSPQHLKWMDEMTKPAPVEKAGDGEREKLPAGLQEALALMDDVQVRRMPLHQRWQTVAKAVRHYYAGMGWADGTVPPAGTPATVKGFLERFSIPTLEDPRVAVRLQREADPYRMV